MLGFTVSKSEVDEKEIDQNPVKIMDATPQGVQGGAWKVAYADFVTAMMAFFLLMWLLSSTTEEQRAGIACLLYTSPSPRDA